MNEETDSIAALRLLADDLEAERGDVAELIAVCRHYLECYDRCNELQRAVTLKGEWIDRGRAVLKRLEQKYGSLDLVRITCPDCGPVTVWPLGYEDGKPVCGRCPHCRGDLFFAK